MSWQFVSGGLFVLVTFGLLAWSIYRAITEGSREPPKPAPAKPAQ